LLCLGIIRPLVGQEGCKLARGSNKDVWVCRISQTAGIYTIYLRVALDEVAGSSHQGARGSGRGSGLPAGQMPVKADDAGETGPGTRHALMREMSGAERRW
jgi:hypothetical protein